MKEGEVVGAFSEEAAARLSGLSLGQLRMWDWFAPLGEVIAAGWEKAKAAIAAVGEWIGGVFERDVLSEGDKAQAKQAGYDFIMSLWNGMKQVMSDLLQWVKDKAAETLGAEATDRSRPAAAIGAFRG